MPQAPPFARVGTGPPVRNEAPPRADQGGGPRRDVLKGDVMGRMAAGKAVEYGGTPGFPDPAPVLGLRENLAQFSLLVLVTAFVGGMVGLERAILPLIADREVGVVSQRVIPSFLFGFGVGKAFP